TDTDTLDSIESAIGSDNSDTFIMDSSFTTDTNTIDGKDGVDVLDYSNYTANGITVNLGNQNEQTIATGDTDQIKDVENLIGGTKNDTITGSDADNSLDGNEGSDRFYGSNGTDIINGGVDSDGTADTDIADYSNMTQKVVVTANGSSYTVLKPDGKSDTLTNIEEIQGSDYKDEMTGDNVVSADDIFKGGDNSDTLIGNLGNDKLYGEEGDDTLRGGAGDDYLHGGADGSDTADFSDATGSGIDVDLSQTGSQTVGGNLGSDTLVDIENVLGSDFADTIAGNDKANTLKGGSGNDTFSFSNTAGETTGDYIDGGDDVDTVDYSQLNSKIEIDLNEENNGATNVTVGTNSSDHQIENVENIKGTAQNDTISGNSSQNTIDGGAGDDTLDGEGGVDATHLDTLIGGLGNDTFVVNDKGFTHYDGTTDQGTGFVDTADFSTIANDSADKVNVNLQDGTFTLNGATINGTTFSGIEGAIGGAGDDSIVGTTTANTLIGGAGDDTLLGNGATSGIDYIDGGANTTNGDFVSFNYTGANGVTVDLSNGS
ncbi:beta strand repeat-containing protein, partial [Poseidonibacter sp.]|uniref:beta strand repeat-containing protein n=1 Tax=Poseidonibacter sp. TaxID=2321188 RepID=UPI003C73A1B4